MMPTKADQDLTKNLTSEQLRLVVVWLQEEQISWQRKGFSQEMVKTLDYLLQRFKGVIK